MREEERWRFKQAAVYLRESLHNRAIPAFINIDHDVRAVQQPMLLT
jgi:hypothetical protein